MHALSGACVCKLIRYQKSLLTVSMTRRHGDLSDRVRKDKRKEETLRLEWSVEDKLSDPCCSTP